MPDRFLNDDGTVIDLDQPAGQHLTAEDRRQAAITACHLCDQLGYRAGSIVCTHIDHAAIAERHRDQIRAQLAQIAARKQPPHPTPDRSPSKP